jgi:hypothetical protein
MSAGGVVHYTYPVRSSPEHEASLPAAFFPEPLPQPGEVVRWRHPRLAFALGWFNAFGPGPFEVVGILDSDDLGPPLSVLVKTPFGDEPIDARWVGVARTTSR